MVELGDDPVALYDHCFSWTMEALDILAPTTICTVLHSMQTTTNTLVRSRFFTAHAQACISAGHRLVHTFHALHCD